MPVKKNSVLPSAQNRTACLFHFQDDGFMKEWPGLYEFLAAATYDGAERKGGSVSIFGSGGKLKAALLDKHTQLIKYLDLDPCTELLSQLEAALHDERVLWQPARKNPGQVPF